MTEKEMDRVRKLLEGENLKRAEFRARLEKQHGVAGHKHADTLFCLAWSMGHASGFSEVEILYEEMAGLLK